MVSQPTSYWRKRYTQYRAKEYWPLVFQVRGKILVCRRQNTGGIGIDTLRKLVVARFAELFESSFQGLLDGDEALAYALYIYLRSIAEVTLSVDNWKMFKIVSESSDYLRGVGIMYVLPNEELPVDLELSRKGDSIDYKVRFGASNEYWKSLSDSKRWQAVYLYATGESEDKWTWLEPVFGTQKIE